MRIRSIPRQIWQKNPIWAPPKKNGLRRPQTASHRGHFVAGLPHSRSWPRQLPPFQVSSHSCRRLGGPADFPGCRWVYRPMPAVDGSLLSGGQPKSAVSEGRWAWRRVVNKRRSLPPPCCACWMPPRRRRRPKRGRDHRESPCTTPRVNTKKRSFSASPTFRLRRMPICPAC